MTGSSDSRPSSDDTLDIRTADINVTDDDLGGALPRRPQALPVGDTPMAVWPAAVALVVMLIIAAQAMHLDHYPLIPFVLIAIVCIRSWNQRWARTVWYATLTAYTLWMVIHTVPLWLPFFFALLAAFILSPIVDPVERLFRRMKVPGSRTISVVLFFIVGIGVLVVFDLFFIAQVRHTIDKLVQGVQEHSITDNVVSNVEYMVEYFGFDPLSEDEVKHIRDWTDSAVQSAQANLPEFGAKNAEALLGKAAQTVGWVVVLAFDFLIFLFATFYLLIGYPKLSSKIDSYFSPERSQRLARLSTQIGKILRSYLQGHTLACLLIGLLYFFILWVFGHPYAALLGLMMGVLSLIPFLGPIVAGLLSVALTLTVGLDTAAANQAAIESGQIVNVGTAMLAVIVAYVVSHGLNDTVIYPQVAGRAVHISPVETLLVLFVIGHFFGILGMFFAVPLWAIARKTVSWMNEEHIPGFEWLKLFRPYEVRHERTLKLQRAASERQAAAAKAEAEWAERKAKEEAAAHAAAEKEAAEKAAAEEAKAGESGSGTSEETDADSGSGPDADSDSDAEDEGGDDPDDTDDKQPDTSKKPKGKKKKGKKKK